jgi:hypothetical protein
MRFHLGDVPVVKGNLIFPPRNVDEEGVLLGGLLGIAANHVLPLGKRPETHAQASAAEIHLATAVKLVVYFFPNGSLPETIFTTEGTRGGFLYLLPSMPGTGASGSTMQDVPESRIPATNGVWHSSPWHPMGTFWLGFENWRSSVSPKRTEWTWFGVWGLGFAAGGLRLRDGGAPCVGFRV